jgi:hypothetical protein
MTKRQIIRALILSPFYFSLPLFQRREMIENLFRCEGRVKSDISAAKPGRSGAA